MLRAAVLAALTTSGACYAPRFADCALACAPSSGECPAGLSCVAGRCRAGEASGSCGADDGGVVDTHPAAWTEPVEVPGLGMAWDEPSVTSDELVLCVQRFAQLYVATWNGISGAWATPVFVSELNGPGDVTSPQISADGLTLYFTTARPGGTGGADIWRATRTGRTEAWDAPIAIMSLNSVADDAGGSTTEDAAVLVMSSRRAGTMRDELFEATFNESTGAWEAPTAMATLNVPPADRNHPALDGAGLTLVFSSDLAGGYDLYIAQRTDRTLPFGAPQPIVEANTGPLDEADPWISPDGATLYFSRGMPGQRRIFRTTRIE